ncbi:hypothetical protein CYMTET_5038 [Cymbomonas tetramitiformis]|uniref:Uncharacterized protein n=1 Tax=Cymbomonas tetramitiformis TaxID=36881 RepID=A0AAE0GZZ7_9CHLO|nr:hypothetical protein CYMTET_5038 [Cymbomonas tetramitiformis]
MHENPSGNRSWTSVGNDDLVRVVKGEKDLLANVDFTPTYQTVLEVKERLSSIGSLNGVDDTWGSVLIILHALKCEDVPDPTSNPNVFKQCARKLATRMAKTHAALRKVTNTTRDIIRGKPILENLGCHGTRRTSTNDIPTVSVNTSNKRRKQLEEHRELQTKYFKLSSNRSKAALRKMADDLITTLNDTTIHSENLEVENVELKEEVRVAKRKAAQCEELKEEVKNVKAKFRTRNVNKRIKRLEEQLFNQQKKVNTLEEALGETESAAKISQKQLSTKTRRLQKKKHKYQTGCKLAKSALHEATNIITQEADGSYDQRSRALVMDLRTVANVNPESCPKAIGVVAKHLGVNLTAIPPPKHATVYPMNERS